MSYDPLQEAPVQTDIALLSDLWKGLADAEETVHRAVAAAVAHPEVKPPPDAELSVALADDAEVKRLNRDYRAKDKPTNVLSFPATHGPMLGDVIIAYETLVKEAADEDIAVSDHLTHLTIHGLLHLLGYDHETEAEAVTMERIETEVLASLGIKDPHATGRIMPDGPHA
ncbi:rRNA maturation RNase YbeY [Phreatobacter stygius]|uniref:Endoribonuclease YbeY n=1 Tax=Phreatobacter stygius TaxID=1940610 RepID=A0A4D7BE19_9HYPH|nr:rRNA maturation RNase YbeY [Phreatobacter stygius]QCI66187.1 rRNA maturation RNase YbeY [Phreatobacter stygius]